MSLTDKLNGKAGDLIGHGLGATVMLSSISGFSDGNYAQGIAFGVLGVLTHFATYRSSKTSQQISELVENMQKYRESQENYSNELKAISKTN